MSSAETSRWLLINNSSASSRQASTSTHPSIRAGHARGTQRLHAQVSTPSTQIHLSRPGTSQHEHPPRGSAAPVPNLPASPPPPPPHKATRPQGTARSTSPAQPNSPGRRRLSVCLVCTSTSGARAAPRRCLRRGGSPLAVTGRPDGNRGRSVTVSSSTIPRTCWPGCWRDGRRGAENCAALSRVIFFIFNIFLN